MLFAVVFVALTAVVAGQYDPYAYQRPYDAGADYTQYYYNVPVYDYYGNQAQIEYNRYPNGVNWNLNEQGPGYSNYQSFQQSFGGYRF